MCYTVEDEARVRGFEKPTHARDRLKPNVA